MDYFARRNPHAAIELAWSIEKSLLALIDFPEHGRMGRVQGTRELVIPGTPYIAVYRIKPGTIEILRFPHGARR